MCDGVGRPTLDGVDRYRDIVEEQLREAMERGDFDGLPGRGRPLKLGDDSPDWWARRKMEELRREEGMTELVQRLQRERDRIWTLTDERAVRDATEELNRHIAEVNPLLREADRPAPLDPEKAVVTWRRMGRLRPS